MPCDNFLFPHIKLKQEFTDKIIPSGNQEMPYKIDLQMKINFPSEKLKSTQGSYWCDTCCRGWRLRWDIHGIFTSSAACVLQNMYCCNQKICW